MKRLPYYYTGHELDVAYLTTLSADAVPPMVAFYQNANVDSTNHALVGGWLAEQLWELDSLRAGVGSTVFSANLARDRAWAMLDGMRSELPVYDGSSSR